MLPLTAARSVVLDWNKERPQFVPWEIVEECLLAFWRWQASILTLRPVCEVCEHLVRHHEFANKVPDELLLLLSDDDNGED